jgi:hypothetical protein
MDFIRLRFLIFAALGLWLTLDWGLWIAAAHADEKHRAGLSTLVQIEPAAGLTPILNPNVGMETLVQEVLLPNGMYNFKGKLKSYRPGAAVKLPVTAVEIPAETGQAPDEQATVAETSPSTIMGSPSTETPPTSAYANNVAPSQEHTTSDEGAFIPPRGPSFHQDLNPALQAIATVPPGSVAAREAHLNLAGIYLAWQRPEEAQAVLATLPRRADGLPAQALPRLLAGVAALARGEGPVPGSFDQTGTLGPAAKLWSAVAANANGAYVTSLEAWPTAPEILADYPEYLQQIAQEAHVNALVMTGQNTQTLRELKALKKVYTNQEFPPALRRLRGLARLGTPQFQEGLEDLAAAAENKSNPAVAAQAKLEFIQTLHRRKEISDAQLRGYLRDLQQEWRGDETERQTLIALANLYDKSKEPSSALKTWQTLLQAYPHTAEIDTITSRMVQAFVAVFDPESEQTYDPLTYLGLYYDFQELLPNDERGNLVQERMAEALMKANLYDRAAPLLEQQLQYRALDPVAQGRLTLLLAEAYRQLNRPEEAIKLLETHRTLATTQTLRRGWILEQARTLAALNRPQAAAQILQPLLAEKQLEDKEAQRLAATVAWQGQDWPAASIYLNKVLQNVPASVVVSSSEVQLQVFQLAYALAQQGQAPQLAQLKTRYQEAWPKLPQLADNINAVAASSGVSGLSPEGGPLQSLTTALGALNSLDGKIDQSRRELSHNRQQREEFNRRMQYMELLPPPAL